MSIDAATTNPLVDQGSDKRNNYEDGLLNDSNLGLPGEGGTGSLAGITAFEAGWQLGNGIADGDFGAAASGAVGAGLDIAMAASDPIGYVAGQCVTWMLDHIEPAREALDSVAGNPAMVKAYAQSWTNVEEALIAVHGDMTAAVSSGTTGWSGAASDGYRAHATRVADVTGGAAGAAHGIAKLTEGMSEIVGGVRTAIRDLLAMIAGALVSWTAKILLTAGTGTPLVVAEAVARIAHVVRTAGRHLDDLADKLFDAKNLMVLLRDLFDGLYKANQALQAE
ncbi:MAG: hypothetical protein GX542_10025 [Rhodococcus sp.]|nr:hypothetical protein [Rhodococcus sp. (in: high G+C Gram-positive bacteria)]